MVPIGFFLTSIALPAWTMLLYWIAIQTFGGLIGILGEERGGVAFWAHIGGFVAGVVLIKLFARPNDVAAHRSHRWRPERVTGNR
jgi:membrane associated rhomboid family serine protease